MKILLLITFISHLVFSLENSSSKLSKDENRLLQRNCGKPLAPSKIRRSIHTKPVARSEAPWAVSLEYVSKWWPNITMEERNPGLRCSGTLISSRHILTAAHCINYRFVAYCNEDGTLEKQLFGPINVDRFTIRFAEPCGAENCTNFKQFDGFQVLVSKIYFPSSYTGFFCEGRGRQYPPTGDIAIFELAEDVPYSDLVYPACLNDRKLNFGDALTQFGYGMTENDDYGNLRKLNSVVVGECGPFQPMKDTICDHDKLRSACGGDSGSGRVVFDKRGVASVAAVVSGGGEGCATVVKKQKQGNHHTYPNFNTDVRSHLHWICAAIGICANEEIEKTVDEYAMLGLTEGWFKTYGPLGELDLYI